MRVWAKYDEEAERRKVEEDRAADLKAQPMVVHVSAQHVVNGNTFFTHMLGEEAKPLLKRIAQQFAQNGDFGAPGSGNRYRAHQYCSAEFEGSMYRAKVLRHDNGWYQVQFIDYGNMGWVEPAQMQPWSGDTALPPQAFECKLAYVKCPAVEDDYGEEAGEFLASQVMGKDCTAQIVAKAGEVYHLMVFNGDECINSECLKSGFFMLTKDAKRNQNPSKELKGLIAAVEQAKRSRTNIWRHGDPESDDEDERPRRAWGR